MLPGHRLLLCAAASLAFSLTAASDPWQVQLITADGSEIEGKLDIGKVHIESELGKFDLEPSLIFVIDFSGQKPTLQMKDGSKIAGNLDVTSWKVSSKLGEIDVVPAKLKRITFRGPVKAVGNPGTRPPDVPGVKPVSTSADDPTEGAELKPEAKGPAPTTIVGRSVLSADGARLYFLSGTESKLCALSTETLAIAASVEIPPGAVAFTVAPDGATAWIVAMSTVSLVNLADFTAKKSFQIEYRMYDIVGIDGNLAVAACDAGLVILDPQKQAALGVRQGIGGPFVRVPGQNRIYAAGGPFTWALDASQPGGVRITHTRQYNETTSSGMSLTSDGRFGISKQGDLFRIGKSPLAANLPAGKLCLNVSALGLKEKLLLFTPDGFLKVHESATFELSRSIQIGISGFASLADEKKGVMYVFGIKRGFIPASTGASWTQVPSPSGTWFRYKIP